MSRFMKCLIIKRALRLCESRKKGEKKNVR
nr:MAG TPA: hypothetical protein [Caudoviricetes sp.]